MRSLLRWVAWTSEGWPSSGTQPWVFPMNLCPLWPEAAALALLTPRWCVDGSSSVRRPSLCSSCCIDFIDFSGSTFAFGGGCVIGTLRSRCEPIPPPHYPLAKRPNLHCWYWKFFVAGRTFLRPPTFFCCLWFMLVRCVGVARLHVLRLRF